MKNFLLTFLRIFIIYVLYLPVPLAVFIKAGEDTGFQGMEQRSVLKYFIIGRGMFVCPNRLNKGKLKSQLVALRRVKLRAQIAALPQGIQTALVILIDFPAQHRLPRGSGFRAFPQGNDIAEIIKVAVDNFIKLSQTLAQFSRCVGGHLG